MRIAIVGNSITLLKYHYGSLIDSCDLIIRMNRYSMDEKFSKSIGYRIDTTSIMLAGHDHFYSQVEHVIPINHIQESRSIWIPFYNPNNEIVQLLLEYSKISKDKISCISESTYLGLLDKLEHIKNRCFLKKSEIIYATSGMTTIERCVVEYPGSIIYVLGFDPFGHLSYKHYWEDGDDTLPRDTHPITAEGILIDKYRSEGKIHLL